MEFEVLTLDDLRKCAAHLAESYPEDLEMSFIDEFVQFTNILVADNDKSITHMSKLLKTDGGRNAMYVSKCCNRSTNISNISNK